MYPYLGSYRWQKFGRGLGPGRRRIRLRGEGSLSRIRQPLLSQAKPAEVEDLLRAQRTRWDEHAE